MQKRSKLKMFVQIFDSQYFDSGKYRIVKKNEYVDLIPIEKTDMFHAIGYVTKLCDVLRLNIYISVKDGQIYAHIF